MIDTFGVCSVRVNFLHVVFVLINKLIFERYINVVGILAILNKNYEMAF